MIFVKQLHVVVIIFIVRSTLKYQPLSFLWLIVIKQAKPTFFNNLQLFKVYAVW